MDVLAILNKKSRPAYTVSVDQSVDDAINLMAAKKVKALIVTDGKRPVGLFAERDLFLCSLLDEKNSCSDVELKRVITGRFISAESTEDIGDVITLMIKSDLDHLPVIDDDRILGLVDFKDLVEIQLESLTGEIHHLKDYIDDLHEAGQD